MNVKSFKASTMSDALAMVRKAFGDEAVILRTRKIKRNGMLSFVSKEMVEVIAAIPDRNAAKKNTSQAYDSQVKRLQKGMTNLQSAEVISNLKEEIMDLKGHIQELAGYVKYDRMPSMPPELSIVFRRLVNAGLEQNIAKDVIQSIIHNHNGEQLENKTVVEKALQSTLRSLIKARKVEVDSGKKSRVIALVGPTGVGKTTTLAKLVTSYRYWGKRKTALLSTDVYRVAAIDQLKTFASIAGLPLEVVYKPNAMKNTLSRHLDKNAVFIDTAGRSQKDGEKLDELEEFLNIAEPDEILLCLSVSTRLEDQLDIINRYKKLGLSGIIFTKLDETTNLASMLNVLSKCDVPAVYITCGQNVPDDILTFDTRKVVNLVLEADQFLEQKHLYFQNLIEEETGQIHAKLA